MCMQCVGAFGTAFQAATVIGGPLAYAGYRRVRATLGLRDTSVAACETATAPQDEGSTAPAPTSRSIASTRSAANCAPVQRRHSARASATVSGTW